MRYGNAEVLLIYKRLVLFMPSPSSGDEAPIGLNHTGNASHCVQWTSTHVPCMTLPLFTGPNGLPVGAQLIAARNHDRLLFDVARWVNKLYR